MDILAVFVAIAIVSIFAVGFAFILLAVAGKGPLVEWMRQE